MANPFLVAARPSGPQASYFRGASFDRLNGDWVYGRMSADQPIRYESQTLRNRARELVANNSTAAAIPKLYAENVVGKDGIILQPLLENSRGQPNDRLNDAIREQWEIWGERGNCTTDGQSSWTDCQRMFVENKVVDGEVFVHLVRGFEGNAFGFAIDFVDPDQLDHYINLPPSTGSNMVRMGIEMDPWFRPVAYHIWTNHPGEALPRKRVRVPASEILHSFYRLRPRQSRGVSLLAPVIFDLKMLGGYREAEVVAARAGAAKMGFIQSREDGVPMEPAPGDPTEKIELEAEAGVIEQLPPGFEFKGWDPQHPTAQFDAFDKAMIRSIASAVRVSYMSLSGDLRGTTYGSGRIGMLEERAVYQALQQSTIDEFSDPVYRAWLSFAVLSGQLDLGSADTRAIQRDRRWHPRNFPWIDPRNDMEAASREVAMGCDSITRIAAERGRDIRDVLEERKAEMDLAAELGVPLVLDKGVPIGGPAFDAADPNADTPADETAHPGPGSPGDPATDGQGGSAPAAPQNGKRPAKPSSNGKRSRLPSRITL